MMEMPSDILMSLASKKESILLFKNESRLSKGKREKYERFFRNFLQS